SCQFRLSSGIKAFHRQLLQFCCRLFLHFYSYRSFSDVLSGLWGCRTRVFLDLAMCTGGSVAGGALLCRIGFPVSFVWRGLSMGKVYRKPIPWMDDRLDLSGLSDYHCSNSGNQTSQINPACHPSKEWVSGKLCPLINPSRQRKLGSQFCKAERHQQLTRQYTWPGPEKRGSGNPITQIKHLKKTGKNRNVRKACSKTGEAADGTL